VIHQPLHTPRLRLEPLAAHHLAAWADALAAPEIGTYIGGPDVEGLDALAERIEALLAGPPEHFAERAWVNLMVFDHDVMVGRVEAAVYDGWAEVAYLFSPTVWGRGYATEAVLALLDALRSAGVVEFAAAVHPDNAASVRLLERLGFERLTAPHRQLASYDPGDLVFRLPPPVN
jgi:RimJ/RimL family protein N-acetyltransferase